VLGSFFLSFVWDVFQKILDPYSQGLADLVQSLPVKLVPAVMVKLSNGVGCHPGHLNKIPLFDPPLSQDARQVALNHISTHLLEYEYINWEQKYQYRIKKISYPIKKTLDSIIQECYFIVNIVILKFTIRKIAAVSLRYRWTSKPAAITPNPERSNRRSLTGRKGPLGVLGGRSKSIAGHSERLFLWKWGSAQCLAAELIPRSNQRLGKSPSYRPGG
jgi:hypothetical protein